MVQEAELESYISQNGYVYVKTAKGWRTKHRYLMEQHLGRGLSSDEHVYFIDKNKRNFDISNLEVRSVAPKKVRSELKEVRRLLTELTIRIEALEALEKSEEGEL